jgi:hypothetical protein
METNRENNQKKTTSEKPITLSPLKFREALAALLKVKPKPKEEKAEKEKNEENDKPSNLVGLVVFCDHCKVISPVILS